MKKVWDFFKKVWPFAKAFICLETKEEAKELFDWMTAVNSTRAKSAGTGDVVFSEPVDTANMPKFYFRLEKALNHEQGQ